MIKISQKTYTNNNGIPCKKANKHSPQLNKLQLINFKGTMSRPAHVRDLRSTSWSNELSAILDLRKIRRFLRFFVRLAPLEVVFSQFTIHFIHLDHQELELRPRVSCRWHAKICELSEVVFLWFKPELSFSPSSRLESLVRVEALAQQNESTTQTEVVPVKQKA